MTRSPSLTPLGVFLPLNNLISIKTPPKTLSLSLSPPYGSPDLSHPLNDVSQPLNDLPLINPR